jgi:hypothetical protein
MKHRVSSFLAVSLCTALLPSAVFAQSQQDRPSSSAVAPANAPVGSAAVNAGRILCTAAINSTGTIATTLAGSFINSATTSRITTGRYQVGFKGPCSNVQSTNGWFRIVQPDTLTGGVLGPFYCTVADRTGNPAGVFIECFNKAGVDADTSFTLSVSR